MLDATSRAFNETPLRDFYSVGVSAVSIIARNQADGGFLLSVVIYVLCINAWGWCHWCVSLMNYDHRGLEWVGLISAAVRAKT